VNYYFAGLDIGQAADYSALAVAERITPPEAKPVYHFRYLERVKLGTSYPEQVAHVKSLMEQPPLKGNVTLALDYTGVGRPVLDMFRAARIPCPLFGISIHGGEAVTWDEVDKYLVRVPKRDLVAVVQVLLQSERLKIAEALSEAKTLVKELLNFRVKIDSVTAHDSYSAWREGQHDDLVLAVALACWIAEKKGDATTAYASVTSRAALFRGKGAY
jgi:hypothetical protein